MITAILATLATILTPTLIITTIATGLLTGLGERIAKGKDR